MVGRKGGERGRRVGGNRLEGGGERGGLYLMSCKAVVISIFDHPSLSRRSTVPAPDRNAYNSWAFIASFPYTT